MSTPVVRLPFAHDSTRDSSEEIDLFDIPTTPAEEWGERIETCRTIARGGKHFGYVPGATGSDFDDPRSGLNRCEFL